MSPFALEKIGNRTVAMVVDLRALNGSMEIA
jgi:hypothetical protein